MYLKQAFKGENSIGYYILTTLIVIIATQTIGVIPILAVTLTKGISLNSILSDSSSGISLNLLLILQIFPFVVGCFALYLCLKYIHRKKFKDLLTSRSSFDYKRALKGVFIWGILLLSMFSYEIYKNDSTLIFNYQPDQFYWLILICLLFLPFQTSLEELLFRGYYMQGTAVTSKNRWVPLIVTSIIFGLLHSANPEVTKFGFWIAMPNYIIMGFILGITAIMDDGLELPLGIHFANNFLGSIFTTSKNSTLQTPALYIDTNPTMSHTDTIITLFSGLLFILICSKIFKWGSFRKILLPIKLN